MSQQPPQQTGIHESTSQQTIPPSQAVGAGAQQQSGVGTSGQMAGFETTGQQSAAGQPGQQYGQEQPTGGQAVTQMGQQPGAAGQSIGQPGQQQPTGGQGFAQPGQQGQFGQPAQGGMNLTLEEGISDEMRVALHDFVQAATVCEWCAERCIDEGPEMAECLRLCRDVADLATLNVQLLARDSIFGPEAAEVFAQAAEACAQECAKHSHKHCRDCAEVLPRAARSTRKMLASFETGTATQQTGSQQPAIAAQSPTTGQF